MERLTEKVGEHFIARQERLNGKIVGNQTCLDKLGELEDAEEQGLLLRLPVPLGTKKLFYIEKGYVYELDATRLSISKFPVSDEIIYEYDFCEFSFDDFGKIVFLTEEEAKAALAEKGGAE